ncbi:MAG: hypothetical protein LBI42_06795 [Chitinispirillales bacterium]|jgi:REP element-mobilizing transposase RayT|nr:hypothetical protein [Chitinispirillales bacterium]
MTLYNLNTGHRRSIRLRGYDYSRIGLYFVTICIHDRISWFGKIVNGKMLLNECGQIAKNEWLATPGHRPNVVLHEFVVMPNHFHAIIEITDTVCTPNAKHTNNVKRTNNACNGVACNALSSTPNAIVLTTNIITEITNIQKNTTNIIMETNDMHAETDNIRAGMDGTQNRGVARNAPAINGGNAAMANISPKRGSLAAIIRAYKSAVSKTIHETNPAFAWQRNYHEHIIRNDAEYNRISEYIKNNPSKWYKDRFYHKENITAKCAQL